MMMMSTEADQKEQLRFQRLQRAQESISRIQRLQKDRPVKPIHVRNATPEFDPDNPFYDPIESSKAIEANLDEFRPSPSSSKRISSKYQTETENVQTREPTRSRARNTPINKSNRSLPTTSASVQLADSEMQHSEHRRPTLRRRQTTSEGENISSKVKQVDILPGQNHHQSRLDGRGKTEKQFRQDYQSNTISPPKRSPQKVRRKTEMLATPELREPTVRGELSEGTKQALANLERSLQQLKSQSPEMNRHEINSSSKRRTDLKNTSIDSSSNRRRSNRALSPSKERINHRNSSRQSETIIKSEAHSSEKPKSRSSFLTRVEQAHGTPLPAEDQQKEYKENCATRIEAQTQTNPIRRRRSLYSYTPPKLIDKEQQCNLDGSSSKDVQEHIGETSASSIKIGEESLDELVRNHGTEKDGKVRQFLQGMKILVDVRDQDGEDASSIWTEKLRNVGAKVYTKVPQMPRKSRSSTGNNKVERTENESERALAPAVDCIIYKNGKPATLHYYRNQIEAGRKMIIVGVNWILHCLREGKKVDENDYLVEVGKQAIFVGRRTSMTPKRAPSSSHDQIDLVPTQPKLADVLARKKVIQNAPIRPSPLANKCWNLDASTSSTLSTATTMTNFTVNTTSRSNFTPSKH